MISRRFLLKRAALIIAAPAIVPIGHLMPVRGIIQSIPPVLIPEVDKQWEEVNTLIYTIKYTEDAGWLAEIESAT